MFALGLIGIRYKYGGSTPETGLDCSIGIGCNRMVAKLASDAAKPRGLMEVREGWEEGFLAGLPLRALPGVGPRCRHAASRSCSGCSAPMPSCSSAGRMGTAAASCEADRRPNR